MKKKIYFLLAFTFVIYNCIPTYTNQGEKKPLIDPRSITLTINEKEDNDNINNNHNENIKNKNNQKNYDILLESIDLYNKNDFLEKLIKNSSKLTEKDIEILGFKKYDIKTWWGYICNKKYHKIENNIQYKFNEINISDFNQSIEFFDIEQNYILNNNENYPIEFKPYILHDLNTFYHRMSLIYNFTIKEKIKQNIEEVYSIPKEIVGIIFQMSDDDYFPQTKNNKYCQQYYNRIKELYFMVHSNEILSIQVQRYSFGEFDEEYKPPLNVMTPTLEKSEQFASSLSDVKKRLPFYLFYKLRLLSPPTCGYENDLKICCKKTQINWYSNRVWTRKICKCLPIDRACLSNVMSVILLEGLFVFFCFLSLFDNEDTLSKNFSLYISVCYYVFFKLWFLCSINTRNYSCFKKIISSPTEIDYKKLKSNLPMYLKKSITNNYNLLEYFDAGSGQFLYTGCGFFACFLLLLLASLFILIYFLIEIFSICIVGIDKNTYQFGEATIKCFKSTKKCCITSCKKFCKICSKICDFVCYDGSSEK